MKTARIPLLLGLISLLAAGEAPVRIAVPGDGPVEVQADPPAEWSVPERKQVAWMVELPFGEDAGGPLVVDDQVVVCTHDEHVIGFSLADGTQRWRTEVSVFDLEQDAAAIQRGKALRDELLRLYAADPVYTGDKPAQPFWEPKGAIAKEFGVPGIARSKYCNHPWGGSPAVADATAIYVKFATGIVGAVDRQGKILWKRRFTAPKGASLVHTTTPHLLCGDRVVVAGTAGKPQDGRQMAISAYACTDGRELWRTEGIAGANHNDWVPMKEVVVAGTSLLVTASGAVLRLDDGSPICPGGPGGSIGNAFWGGRIAATGDSVWFGLGRTRLQLEGKDLTIMNHYGTYSLAGLKDEDTVSGSERLSLVGGRLFAIGARLVELDPEIGATRGAGKDAAKLAEKARFDQLFVGKPGKYPPLVEPAAAAGRLYLPAAEMMQVLDLASLQRVAANPCGGRLIGAPMPAGSTLVFRTIQHLVQVAR